ncbi:glycosyltransferase involved in cell wall biosynthesis [Salinibacter ruber]|uniref:glycosyltransferase family 2 protein n=1 Tax=Salinibacter ruber TaxID=146919 RepID=UPI0021688F12|nr:glycosyltransferase family 2 protein [Salinibacter ruber]MCS3672817.1 glycosyltransferase involved in cell wall biosynthesis [Salinibacter ruber]
MRPDVSVVIPTYNRRSMVQEAIESCFAGNEGIDVEVVVVDDGSTDSTRAYLEGINDKRVRPLFQKHQGAQVARNRGQRAAHGRTIKHLDDDDYLLPGMLQRQYEHLVEQNVDVCYGDFLKQDVEESETWRFRNAPHTDFFVALLSKELNRLQLALLFDAEAIHGIKWDESLDYLQDVDFMVRAASRGLSCAKLDEPVALHRIHGSSRISDVRQSTDPARRLTMRCTWFYEAFLALRKHVGTVTPEQRQAAATGLWREAHKLAPFDWARFRRWYDRVLEIEPTFTPPREHTILSVLDRAVGPVLAERILNPLRKARLRR